MDRNGYNPSIMQDNELSCWYCGASDQHLDRHEIFGGAFRNKSKRLGLWVSLCHSRCHLNGVHKYSSLNLPLKQEGQLAIMEKENWPLEKFIAEFGKNYIS